MVDYSSIDFRLTPEGKAFYESFVKYSELAQCHFHCGKDDPVYYDWFNKLGEAVNYGIDAVFSPNDHFGPGLGIVPWLTIDKKRILSEVEIPEREALKDSLDDDRNRVELIFEKIERYALFHLRNTLPEEAYDQSEDTLALVLAGMEYETKDAIFRLYSRGSYLKGMLYCHDRFKENLEAIMGMDEMKPPKTINNN